MQELKDNGIIFNAIFIGTQNVCQVVGVSKKGGPLFPHYFIFSWSYKVILGYDISYKGVPQDDGVGQKKSFQLFYYVDNPRLDSSRNHNVTAFL